MEKCYNKKEIAIHWFHLTYSADSPELQESKSEQKPPRFTNVMHLMFIQSKDFIICLQSISMIGKIYHYSWHAHEATETEHIFMSPCNPLKISCQNFYNPECDLFMAIILIPETVTDSLLQSKRQRHNIID